MSSLTAFFSNAENQPQDSEKLLSLYWNRAELKKEFAEMRKEQFRLQDKIRQQEGESARLQQILDHLENLLEDPQWAANVMVYYQLRGLATHCKNKLSRFAEQLKQQREKKLHDSTLLAWNQDRTREMREVERRILMQRQKIQELNDQMQEQQDRYMSMSGFLRFFKRRSARAAITTIAEQIQVLQQEEEALSLTRIAIKERQPPAHSGLDTPTKRSINLMILAFAQQLYVGFAEDELAIMVKEAGDKSVGAINYGDQEECEQLLKRIRAFRKQMEQAADFAAELQERAKQIGAKAIFHETGDTVPDASSVATVFVIKGSGVVGQRSANLLGENYWGISNTLSR